jgi:ATP-dependent protease ClpP protease subunit
MSELNTIPITMNEDTIHIAFKHPFKEQTVQALIQSIRLGFDYYKYPEIKVELNSPGGDIVAMHTLLQEVRSVGQQKKQLSFEAGRLCASAAAFVLAHGRWGSRTVRCDTELLFHSPYAKFGEPHAINVQSGELLVKTLAHKSNKILQQIVQHLGQQSGGMDALFAQMRLRLKEVHLHWASQSESLYEMVDKKNDKPTPLLQRLGAQLDRWSKLKNAHSKSDKLIALYQQRFDQDTTMDLREAYALCLIDKVGNLLPVPGYVPQFDEPAAPEPSPLDTPRSCG